MGTPMLLPHTTITVTLTLSNPLTTFGSLLIELLTSKNYERPASPQMVPLGFPDAQAWGLCRGSAGAHTFDIHSSAKHCTLRIKKKARVGSFSGSGMMHFERCSLSPFITARLSSCVVSRAFPKARTLNTCAHLHGVHRSWR